MECGSFAWDFGVGLLAGLVSGVVSGLFVSFLIRKHEKKRDLYLFWKNYLYRALNECNIYLPIAELENVKYIGGKGTKWHEAVNELLHHTKPDWQEMFSPEEHEAAVIKCYEIAIGELEKWNKRTWLQTIIEKKTCHQANKKEATTNV